MFDSFSRSFGSTSSRLAESDRSGTADPAHDPSFGAIASYQICGCCGGFHAVTDGTDGGGQGLILNADDRGVFGPNGKPSLDPIDAGAQITRSNLSWAPGLGQAAVVTFAFRDTFVTSLPADTSGHTSFSAAQISATLLALAAWSEVANITFQRVTDGGTEYSENATILFGNYSSGQSGAAAFAYLPGSTAAGAVQGDVWINNSLSYNATPVMQGYGQQVLLHEIGHAIGLSHPAAYNASADGVITYAGNATYFEDSRQYTVMSYFSERETGADFRGGGANRYSAVPLLDDIAAAQRLYGANTTTRTGDTVYGFNSNAGQPWFSATSSSSALIFAVWDAGGTDTFNFSGYSVAQTIDLRQGAFSSVGGLIGNVAIAIGVVIENVVGGTGVDSIRGNSASNVITGNGGNDEIDGGLGSDTVVFSGARSSYTITWNGQVGTVTGLGATVTVSNVEFLQFSDTTIAAAPTGGLLVGGDITNETINGTAFGDTIGGLGGNDTIHGMAGADTLDGGSGDDVLNGGDNDDLLIGGRGDDALNGGAGHDVADYAGAGAGVTVNLATGLASGGAGTDTLSGIEELRGTAYADTLTGDGAANVLRGGGGIDTLNGGGGADQLFAGTPGEGGGAPDIIKPSGTANNSIANAVSLAGGFDLGTRADVANSTTIPHATVVATGHGGVEYYAVTVAAGDTVVFDIDNASFDSVLRLYSADLVRLAQNDDSASDGGPATDSGLSYTFAAAGTYYIEVSQWQSGADETLTTLPLWLGSTYTLHVSVPSAPVVALDFLGATMNGEAGADILTGGVGRDALNGGADDDLLNGGAENDAIDGGAGADTAVFSGNRAAYTISTNSGVTTVTGPDGADSLTNVERLQFADGLYDITGAPLDTGPINGTPNADELNGTDENDEINGFGGNDVLRGGAGDDALDGGADRDTLYGEDGNDLLRGGGDGDILYGGSGGDIAYSGDGDDYVSGGVGDDYIEGGDGADELHGELGADRILGGFGADRLYGEDGNDFLEGGEDGDIVIAGAGGDIVLGGVGDDYVNSGDDDDYVNGEGGADVLVGGAGADHLLGGDGNDNLQGGSGANRLEGGEGGDILYGGDDGDILLGQNGDDYIAGGEGDDYVHGQVGFDVLLGQGGADVMLGGEDNDYLFGGAGRDTLDGGDGDDWLEGGDDGDVLLGGAGRDTVSGGLGDDYVNAGDGDNYATGDEGADVLIGGSGADRLLGGTGADVLQGGDGANRLEGGDGDDTLYGGVDADTLLGQNGDDYLVAGAGADYAHGEAGLDVLLGQDGDDILLGGGGNDILYGGAGQDRLEGGDDGDQIYGGDNSDVVLGEHGDDALFGDGGNDTLVGGAGVDYLTGGDADDTFVVRTGEGSDRVLDFGAGASSGDLIQLIGTGWSSFAEVTANSIQSGSDVIIHLSGGDTLTLVGVNLAALDAGDFVFTEGASVASAEPIVPPGLSEEGAKAVPPETLPGLNDDDAFVLPPLGDHTPLPKGTDDALVLPAQESELLFQIDPVAQSWRFGDHFQGTSAPSHPEDRQFGERPGDYLDLLG